jgi:hypothetical protein
MSRAHFLPMIMSCDCVRHCPIGGSRLYARPEHHQLQGCVSSVCWGAVWESGVHAWWVRFYLWSSSHRTRKKVLPDREEVYSRDHSRVSCPWVVERWRVVIPVPSEAVRSLYRFCYAVSCRASRDLMTLVLTDIHWMGIGLGIPS